MTAWRDETQRKRDRAVWDEELDAFVPEQVLDFHVHVFQEGVIPAGASFSCGGHAITKYGMEELDADLSFVFPNRIAKCVCFGFPDPAYNCAANNTYLSSRCDNDRFFALRLFDPHKDTPAGINADLAAGRFLGLKPYPDFVRKPDVNTATVEEMLPRWVMEIANERHAIIMLHIPRKARLADDVNQRQVAAYCEAFPDARIVLAHIGRAYYLKNVVGHLDRLRDYPNLYVDLAMLNHWEVLEYTFTQFPSDRILFGSDIPIALAPGKSVEINDQYTYVTPVPWRLSISDDHRKLLFTSFLNEELRAIRKACERAELGPEFVQNLFYHNGMRLLMRSLERNGAREEA